MGGGVKGTDIFYYVHKISQKRDAFSGVFLEGGRGGMSTLTW